MNSFIVAGVVPSGCVNPESTNEKTRKGNKTQFNSRRSDVSHTHVWRKEGKRLYIQNNWHPYKEETKIPSHHPQKKKNINCFSHSKDHHNSPWFPSCHAWTPVVDALTMVNDTATSTPCCNVPERRGVPATSESSYSRTSPSLSVSWGIDFVTTMKWRFPTILVFLVPCVPFLCFFGSMFLVPMCWFVSSFIVLVHIVSLVCFFGNIRRHLK